MPAVFSASAPAAAPVAARARRSRLPARCALAALLAASLCGPLAAHAHKPGAHVHGAAELDVAVEGAQLEIVLEAPLESLLGFEHAPRTEDETKAVRALAARLRDASGLFAPTPEAGCAPASVQLASAVLPPDLLGEAAPAAAAGGGADGHADLDARFVFRCAAPQRLQGLDTSLLKAFPRLRTVKVQVAGPRGQKAQVLGGGRASVRW